jgi:hypothetical protein
MNDERLERWAGDAVKLIRAKYPDLRLGISDCSMFWQHGYEYRDGQDLTNTQMAKGLDEVLQLIDENAKPDFFSTHGHKPNGVWPDMRSVYAALDTFAARGVKLHVSEATLDIGMPMLGPGRDGSQWDEATAAQFFERFYTVLFSHPAMEAINYWDLGLSVNRGSFSMNGMGSGGTGQAGLLNPDNNFEPRPLYYKLKELIHQRWTTKLAGPCSDQPLAFRGFYGEYEAVVHTPAGKTLRGTFTLKEGNTAPIKVKLTEDTGSTTDVAKGE